MKNLIKRGKIILFISVAVVLILSLNIKAQNSIIVKEKKITDNVIVFTIEGIQSTNITAVYTDDGIIVIDSETSPVFVEAIRKKIEEKGNGKKIRYLINTHHHGDHTYGNQVFADAVVIGHEKCKEEMIKNKDEAANNSIRITAMIKSLKDRLSKMDIQSEGAKRIQSVISYYESVVRGLGDNFRLTPPTKTFEDEYELNLGGVKLSLLYYGYSHSISDIVILCPKESLLITGDIFAEGEEPYYDSDRVQYISKWKTTLGRLMADTNKIKNIIPGHGNMLPVSLLQKYYENIISKQKEFQGKESAFYKFKSIYEKDGINASLKILKELKANQKYYFLYPEFDTYTYKLMLADKLGDAIEIFKALTGLFPDSYIAFDSLGEAYFKKGDKDIAKKYFKKSLELNPENENAKNKLEQLNK